MKRLLAIAMTLGLISLGAQAQLSIGAKAGVNFASVVGDDTDDTSGRTGLHLGAVANIPVSELFAVQPELVYSTQGYTVDGNGADITAKLDYLNIPILADFTILEGLSLQGGPQVGITVTDEADNSGNTAELQAKTADIGAVLGAQYRLPLGLFFQLRYATSLSSSLDDIEINGTTFQRDAKNAVLSISAGWFFN